MSNQETKKIKKIGVLTSGGDAPGMNACIRAVVRAALAEGIETIGFLRGYDGLLKGDYINLDSKAVSETLHRGGTILYSARCKEMMTDEGRDRAAEIYKLLKLDGLIIIGGDGSLTGGVELAKRGVNVMGIPGTIDLDLACSEYTIGFDTAVNTAMDAISKIRDTSSSHDRCTVIEVMGRNCGAIALWCAIINGAEEVLIPEKPGLTEEDVIEMVLENRRKGKVSSVIIVAEGYDIDSIELAKKIEKVTGIETRATILGHLQRGGTPTALDRMEASMMGAKAVEELVKGNTTKVTIKKDGKHTTIDILEGLAMTRDYDNYHYDLVKRFAL